METRWVPSGLVRAGAILAVLSPPLAANASDLPSPDDIRSIAEEALVYALPMVMDYMVLYEYAVDKGGNQYKAPFNQIFNEARVFTPKDTAVVTPNSDTPYSFVWMDLRAEPMVLCVPEIGKDRYYSVMLNSQYTYNFGYIGSRATGNGAGCYMVAGPEWSGETPAGIDKVFQSGTDFAIAVYRTQLEDPEDMANVKAIQAGYSAQSLSAHLAETAPTPAPSVDWPKIDKDLAKQDPFGYLAFLLQFAPAAGAAEVEIPLRERFASIGIEPGKPFSTDGWTDAQMAALADGIKAGMAGIEAKAKSVGETVNGWNVAEGMFGSRQMLGEDYLTRATAAVAGIFGNDSAEALYPVTRNDGTGQPLSGANAYTLTFPADGYPPVHAFWSVTMYDGKTQLLIENPIDRYLVNSPMLPDLQKNDDGSLTIYIQHDEPTDPKAKANWLPAPAEGMYIAMRLYWPEEAALDGTWKPPAIERVMDK